MPAGPKPNTSTVWIGSDLWAFCVGLMGGLFFSNAAVWSYSFPGQHVLKQAVGIGPTDLKIITSLLSLMAFLVMPAAVSALARRWTFLWGLFPLLIGLLSIDTEEWMENGRQAVEQDVGQSLVIVLGCLLFTSGPVSLIRWLRARPIREAAQAAAYLAQREAASVPHEGAWPPPPDYRA